MGSGGNKVIENKPLDTQTKAAIEQTNTVSPWEQYATDYFNKYTAWENAPGPKDITTAPGMEFANQIYGQANQQAMKARMGDPSRAFTANLPGFNNQLQQQKEMQLAEARAQALSDAFQQNRQSIYGIGQSGSQAETDRLSNYSRNWQAYNQAYYGRPRDVPLWEKLTSFAIGGLGAAGQAASGLGSMGYKPFG